MIGRPQIESLREGVDEIVSLRLIFLVVASEKEERDDSNINKKEQDQDVR